MQLYKVLQTTCAIFGLSCLCIAQLAAQVVDDCACAKNFDFLVNTAKVNYVDYRFRVNSQNQARFQAFTDSLRIQAQKASGPKCLSVLEKWVNFFQDPHFIIHLNVNSPRNVSEVLAPVEQSNLPGNRINEYLSTLENKTMGIEGLWLYTDPTYLQTYQIAIIKDKKKGRDFAGIITQSRSGFWSEGQIRLTIQEANGVYKVNYFDEHHNRVKTVLQPGKDAIQIKGVGKLYRAYTSATLVQNAGTANYMEITTITPQTTYIRISDLFYQHGETISAFLEENKGTLSTSEQLIVDLRDNPGGMYWPLNKLLPLLYTHPIRDPGGVILASEDNITAYSRLALRGGSYWQNNLYPTPLAMLDSMKAHKNQLVVESSDDTTRMERVMPNPKRIAFLVNENTMSAAETFLIPASQSRKVTIFGQATRGGTLSGGGNLLAMPCSLFKLYYPMLRNTWVPDRVSREGKIIPQVRIPESTEDWVTFVLDYWKQP
jgi:hypothetical protein